MTDLDRRFQLTRHRLGGRTHLIDTDNYWACQETLCEQSTRYHRVGGPVNGATAHHVTCTVCTHELRRNVTEWLTAMKARPPTGQPPEIERMAWLSPEGTYRYRLGRTWDHGSATLAFVMLNPSTADATIDDPTVRCCMSIARRERFGGIDVVNLFAWRSPNPDDLASSVDDIFGPYNRDALETVIGTHPVTVAAWGASYARIVRHRRHSASTLSAAFTVGDGLPELVANIADRHGTSLMCLGVNADGSPRHPSRLKADTPFTVWTPPRQPVELATPWQPA